MYQLLTIVVRPADERFTRYAWNAFEGCCVAAGSWYAVWPKHKATDDYDMLKNQLAPQQYWVKTVDNKEPGGPDPWVVQTVYAEESLP